MFSRKFTAFVAVVIIATAFAVAPASAGNNDLSVLISQRGKFPGPVPQFADQKSGEVRIAGIIPAGTRGSVYFTTLGWVSGVFSRSEPALAVVTRNDASGRWFSARVTTRCGNPARATWCEATPTPKVVERVVEKRVERPAELPVYQPCQPAPTPAAPQPVTVNVTIAAPQQPMMAAAAPLPVITGGYTAVTTQGPSVGWVGGSRGSTFNVHATGGNGYGAAAASSSAAASSTSTAVTPTSGAAADNGSSTSGASASP